MKNKFKYELEYKDALCDGILLTQVLQSRG